MSKGRYLSILLFFVSVCSFGQTTYFVAVNDGVWSDPNTWSTTFNGAGGAGVPTSADFARTNGRSVIVDGDVTIRRLFVTHNVANGIKYDTDNGLDPYTITVTELMVGYNGTFATGTSVLTKPTTTVIELNQDLRFRFTGSVGTNVLRSWSNLAPLPYVIIDAPSLTIQTQDATSASTGGEFRVRYTLEVNNGTFQPQENVGDYSNLATLSVATGATLDLSLASISGDGTNTTKFNNVNISGTVTISNSQYLNANTLTLNSAGTLNVNSSGAGQTQGWWYQTASPSGAVTLNGTVNYAAGADQAIATVSPYNILTLTGSSTTKTATSGGGFQVNGAFTIGSSVTLSTSLASSVILRGSVSNSGSWSPSQVVRFDGTGTQTLTGNTVVFAAGLDVGNSTTTPATTLDLGDNLDVNGQLRIFANATLDINDNTLNLAGNLSNSGSLINDGTGLATIIFDGTTSVSGSGTNSFPNVTVSGSFTAPSSLTITGNLSISGTYTAGANLNLAGNFTKSAGTFTANSGTVTFNGTSAQNLNGIATFNNIIVSNANTATAAGTITLQGTLTLSGSGKFNAGTGTNFIIASTDLGTGGRIAALTTPSNFSGSVTIERFVDGPDDWRYLSMPITNGNVGMWQDDFSVTGNFSDATTPAQDPDVVSASAPSIYSFDGATQTYIAVGSGSTTAGTSLSNTTGYSAYVYETSDFTIDVTGTIGKGGINIATAANQYNLVPNPYPSAIDWDNVTTTGFSSNVYLTTSQGNFATYNKGTGIGVNHPDGSWTGQIAMGQSFWVQSTGATTLPLTETAKTSTYEFVREASPRDYFKIKLNSFSQQTDEIAISFRDEATIGNDPDYDGLKRPTDGLVNLSSYISDPNLDYSINTLPRIQCTQAVKLKFNSVSSDAPVGEYVLTFSELDKLDLGYEVTLKDNFSATEANIDNGFSYTFQVTNDASSKGSNRFEIILKSPDIDITKNLSLQSTVECNNEMAKISFADSQPGVQYLFKLNDTSLHAPVAGNGSSISAFIPKSDLSYGANKLDLVASSIDGCNAHIFSEAISVNLYELKEVSTVTSGTSCGEGSLTLTAQGAPIDGHYKWYESSNAIEPIPNAMGSSFTTPLLSETRMYYVTAVNASGCESVVRAPVEAKIVKLVAPDLTVEGNTIVTSKSVGLQWLKDGEPIDGATSSTYTVTESGVYSVSYSASGCTTVSDGVKFSITGIDEGTSEDISVYPNPTTDFVHVKSRAIASSQIHVYDSHGRKMVAQSETTGNDKVTVDLRRFSKGVYLIYIQNGNKVQQVKAIKK
jgi:hypothetical protein